MENSFREEIVKEIESVKSKLKENFSIIYPDEDSCSEYEDFDFEFGWSQENYTFKDLEGGGGSRVKLEFKWDYLSEYQAKLLSDFVFTYGGSFVNWFIEHRVNCDEWVMLADDFEANLDSMFKEEYSTLTSKIGSYIRKLELIHVNSECSVDNTLELSFYNSHKYEYEEELNRQFLTTTFNIMFYKFPLEMQFLFFQAIARESRSEFRKYGIPDFKYVGFISYLVAHSNSIVSFKFPYAMACIAARTCVPQELSKIKKLIYNGLKWIAEDQIFSAKIIASYKLLLKDAKKKSFISKHQQYELDSIAEDNKTFSDPRFLVLRGDVEYLLSAVKTNQENIKKVGMSLNELKDCYINSKKRAVAFGVAKTILGVVGAAGLASFLESVVDLSDLSELGALIFDQDASDIREILDRGYDYLERDDVKKSLINGASTTLLNKVGLDPQEFFDVWAQSHVVLAADELPKTDSQKYLPFSGDKLPNFFPPKKKERQVTTAESEQSNWLSENSYRFFSYGATGLIILLVCYLLFQNNATDSTYRYH